MGLHGTEKLLHNKRNGHQIEDKWEKIFASHQADKEILNQGIQGAQKTSCQKKSMTQ
jgi:hypothetical protein